MESSFKSLVKNVTPLVLVTGALLGCGENSAPVAQPATKPTTQPASPPATTSPPATAPLTQPDANQPVFGNRG